MNWKRARFVNISFYFISLISFFSFWNFQFHFQGKHELDTDAEMDLLEKIKLKHEQLEAERKVFEDLEFRTMEEEAQMEAEIEEVSMVMNTTQKELDTAETVVSEMELQKAEISINQDVSILQVLTTSQTEGYYSDRYLIFFKDF